MGIARFVRFGLLAGIVCLPVTAVAQQDRFQIIHAERIALLPGTAASTAELKARPADVNLRFSAYGRQFDLQLESNDRLLVNLPAAERNKLLGYRLLRGTLRDHPGSWVRLTRTPSGDYGALWDGEELYTLSPAASVRQALTQSVAAEPNDTLIFRQIDTNADQGQAFCSIVDPASGATSSSPVARTYKTLLGELQQATDLRGQIEVALIGDNEFVARNPVDPQAALLARLNIVDGIFSAQVGVTILATQFELFSGVVDPFTSTAASTLLDQLASYRAATPAIQSRGLAHLVTGTNLDGNTAGIAYLSSLCQPRVGVSLSEDRGAGISTSALIMAHELGHNFGAPHDGEAGACSTTPQSFLMAPAINGSSTFSSCSLTEMQSRILAATCIAPATSFADVSVTNTVSSVRAVAGQQFEFQMEVSSPGTLGARNVVARFRVPSGFSVGQIPVPCSLSSDLYTCALGNLAPGETRQLPVSLNTLQVGNVTSSVSVTADNDRYASNNTQNLTFEIVQGSDGLVRFSGSSLQGLARTPIDIDASIDTTGTEILRNSTASFYLGALTPLSATSDAGICSLVANGVICPLGDLQPPRTLGVHIRASNATAITETLQGTFSSADDSVPYNNVAFLQVYLAPRSDVGLHIDNLISPVGVDVPFTANLQVASLGVETASNVVIHIAENFGIQFDSLLPSQGSCTPDVSGYLCSLGNIPAGQTRTIAMTIRGTEIGNLTLYTSLSSATFDDDTTDNVAYADFDVLRDRDMELPTPPIASGYDATDFYATIPVVSAGMNAVSNVAISVTLPPAFTIRSAFLQDANCVVTGNVVQCTAASIAGRFQDNLILVLANTTPGVYAAPVTLTASNDDFAGNNGTTLDIEVRPFIDTTVRFVNGPASVVIGEPFPLQIVIEQNRNAANNVTFEAGWGGSMEYVSLQGAPSGCTATYIVTCSLGTLAAGSTTTLTLTMRATSRTAVFVTAQARSPLPNGSPNNQTSFQVFADREGDAAVTAQGAITGTSGTGFLLPAINVTASRTIDEATVDVEFSSLSVAQVTAVNVEPAGYCRSIPGSTLINCSLGVLASGESRQIHIQMVGGTAGTMTAKATLTSPNDTNAANNVASLSISVSDVVVVAVPPPNPNPPPATPTASGGGGGTFDPRWIALLIALACWRQVKRRQRSHGS